MPSHHITLTFEDHTLHGRVIAPAVPNPADRPTLVFLHDSLGCDTVWRDFPDRLAAALCCEALVYDRRGYGRSAPFAATPRRPDYLEREADVLGHILARRGIRQAVLFGHSDGGSIALVAAARFPDQITAVVTEGAHVLVEPLTLAGIRTARDALRTTDLRERLQRHHGDKTDAVTGAWIDVWLSPAFQDWSIERHLPGITAPVLVLQGARDEYGTADQVQRIVRGVRGPVDSCLMPGVGHTPHREAADEMLMRTVNFLRTHVAALTAADR